MKKYYAFLTIFLGWNSIIFPQETFRLVPVAPVGIFVNGREYIPLSNDQIRVELGYDGTNGKSLVFDLVIMNQTGDTLSVDPLRFYYLSLDDPDSDSSGFEPRMASAPEREFQWYDQALTGEENSDIPYPFRGFMEAGIEFISAASAFLSAFDPDLVIESSFYQADQDIGGDRTELEWMRSLKLNPGEVSHGFISFPYHSDTDYFLFCIPLEDQEFQFVYQELESTASH